KIDPQFLYVIEQEEFKIEDAKEAIKEAYIASNKKKFILLVAKKYNVYSQNGLLKVLEEPPLHIVFIILTDSKSSLLPTVRSRLPITVIKDENKDEFSLDIKRVDLEFLYNFLQKDITKDEAKDVIKALLKGVYNSNIWLKEEELEQFSTAMRLLELNSNVKNILTTLFLIILEAKKR
ncbi:MAG TPA: DNA polymerase III subunit delta', partial [Campylobacterales bacterium]|nr:DNA polymerase III subunit delta' [Campylobacterales bacterium]